MNTDSTNELPILERGILRTVGQRALRSRGLIWLAIVAIIGLMALMLGGCAEPRAVVPGAIAAPTASQGVSSSTEAIIAGKANAEVSGDTKTAKALEKALQDQNKSEIAGSNLRLIALGILLAAVGAGLIWYGATRLGGAVAVTGGAVVGGALFVTSILPYLGWIALGGGVLGLVALFWHLHLNVGAVKHLVAGGTELKNASKPVLGLIAKETDRAKARVGGLFASALHFGHLMPGKPSPVTVTMAPPVVITATETKP